MKAVWKRIHTWLDANAPKGYGNLRPGASAEAIRAAEGAMGVKLREMVKSWRRWARHDPRYATRVPVAWGGAGDYVFVDLGSGAEQPGRLIVQRSDHDGTDPVTPSFRAWLEGFAEQLEDDEFTYSEEHGEIMYADEIDPD
jgi:cell wall assembly regulator SMI1